MELKSRVSLINDVLWAVEPFPLFEDNTHAVILRLSYRVHAEQEHSAVSGHCDPLRNTNVVTPTCRLPLMQRHEFISSVAVVTRRVTKGCLSELTARVRKPFTLRDDRDSTVTVNICQ